MSDLEKRTRLLRLARRLLRTPAFVQTLEEEGDVVEGGPPDEVLAAYL